MDGIYFEREAGGINGRSTHVRAGRGFVEPEGKKESERFQKAIEGKFKKAGQTKRKLREAFYQSIII